MKRNVVPFKAPEPFAQLGIDWTKEPASDFERSLREAYLTFECSSSQDGLTSLLLLALVSRRQGGIGEDLAYAADVAEITLAMQLRKHQVYVLDFIRERVTLGDAVGRGSGIR